MPGLSIPGSRRIYICSSPPNALTILVSGIISLFAAVAEVKDLGYKEAYEEKTF